MPIVAEHWNPFQLIGAPYIDPDCGTQMHANYNRIDVLESSYVCPKGGKANNLKLGILSQALQKLRSELCIFRIVEHSKLNMFISKYNLNRRAVCKLIVTFF